MSQIHLGVDICLRGRRKEKTVEPARPAEDAVWGSDRSLFIVNINIDSQDYWRPKVNMEKRP